MTATRTRCRLVAVAVLVAAGLAPVAHAAESRATGWILTRSQNVATPIEGILSASGISEESAVVMFATTGSAARRRLDYRFVTTTAEWGVDGWAQVNDDRVPAVACPAACENPAGVERNVYVTSNERALTSTVYIAAFDVRDPTLTITSPGWVVRRWQPAWRTITTGNAKGSSMISAAHTSIGTYRGGQLPGGRYGSFASSALPCDIQGEGSATLTGGTRSWPMSCANLLTKVDGAPVRTSWRVAGEVTGVGWWTAVLIVVDYPR
ncbi:MAG TPA: hypothetical protein VNA20_06190 [Frankiaceae bacterium]|nr:hypothetical protein [Frankiaceae bacterium]